jgi:AcrR family transcriptional regulator
MARWEPDSRGRLEQAALELFAEQGFERTTVAEIAARAGVTERTYFRHFADKREVLFGGSDLLRDELLAAVAAAPDSSSALDMIAGAIDAFGRLLQARAERAALRQQVIADNPELQERELVKLASLATALAAALVERGIPQDAARLSAEAGIAVLKVAFERWTDEGGTGDIRAIIRDHFAQLATITART